ncbi:undecaprenyl-phosphate glucose phosphotransferase [Bradyrhizobium symbiodeficiens]|uniref:Undecaprenyl-phosphate glucose phosphotransferase n=1 Tax=Bradyrhizobium symbiodeficiens TaxID=1404367 RepID=A0A6G8ZZ90_9BRAD|nr:undecaprenyl-phosphate glucose phosphotransferase [Bradyrhizobium symbiodeficiens]QIP05520.1 undecaprenyl-phosphate glucose phosphotransferase [Bradyrhizobium symbiodeficiens]
MSKAPRLSVLPSQEARQAYLDDAPEHHRDVTRRVWHHLLRPKFIETTVAIVDFLLIVTASIACSAMYYALTDGGIAAALPYAGVGLIVAVNYATIMTARRNYRLKVLTLFAKQARETIVIWSGVFAMLAVVAFTMKISINFSRGAVILFFAGGLGALLCWRQIAARFIARSLANGLFARKRIIVVAERDQSSSSRPLAELLSYGYVPVRTFEISREEIAATGITRSLQSKFCDIIEVARNERIEDVYLLLRWRNDRTIDGILDALAVLPISVHLVPDGNAARFLSYPIANVGTTWTAVLKRTPLTRVELAAKRLFDVSFAMIGLLTFLPLMLMTAVLIKLDSRGPIFFRQKRDGFNGRTFDILKFRTMHVLEDGAVVKQATRNDPRITRLGRLLRKSSIDELPQLLNVIFGDMSLVGPRPHATSHNSEYEKLIANYAFRHHVKPGLTGWAQVNGYRGETRQIEQMKQRVEHDLWYINNWSPWLDLRIVLRTLAVALWQDGAY